MTLLHFHEDPWQQKIRVPTGYDATLIAWRCLKPFW